MARGRTQKTAMAKWHMARSRRERIANAGCRMERSMPQVADGESQSPVHKRRSSVVGLGSLFFSAVVAVFLVGAAFAVDGDVVFKREGGEGGVAVAVFPHWFHRIRYKCYACHPSVFEMKAGANKVTMDAIGEGKFCGVCHNGKIAWAASFETCNRCHAEK